jgi:hypothetical protein
MLSDTGSVEREERRAAIACKEEREKEKMFASRWSREERKKKEEKVSVSREFALLRLVQLARGERTHHRCEQRIPERFEVPEPSQPRTPDPPHCSFLLPERPLWWRSTRAKEVDGRNEGDEGDEAPGAEHPGEGGGRVGGFEEGVDEEGEAEAAKTGTCSKNDVSDVEECVPARQSSEEEGDERWSSKGEEKRGENQRRTAHDKTPSHSSTLVIPLVEPAGW